MEIPLILSRTECFCMIKYRAIAAMITVNIVIFVYVYDAFHENLECDKEKEE